MEGDVEAACSVLAIMFSVSVKELLMDSSHESTSRHDPPALTWASLLRVVEEVEKRPMH